MMFASFAENLYIRILAINVYRIISHSIEMRFLKENFDTSVHTDEILIGRKFCGHPTKHCIIQELHIKLLVFTMILKELDLLFRNLFVCCLLHTWDFCDCTFSVLFERRTE